MKSRGIWLGVLVATLGTLISTQALAQFRRRRPPVRYWGRVVSVPVYVNGNRLIQDALMLKAVGRTMLPMRDLFTSIGASVTWDGPTHRVYAWKDDGTGVMFEVDERESQALIVNGPPRPGNWGTVTETRTLEAPPMLMGRTVYIPVRAAAESLNADVRWVGGKPAVHIWTGSRTDVGSAPAGIESTGR
jgi:copper amine oxidase-like protein